MPQSIRAEETAERPGDEEDAEDVEGNLHEVDAVHNRVEHRKTFHGVPVVQDLPRAQPPQEPAADIRKFRNTNMKYQNTNFREKMKISTYV